MDDIGYFGWVERVKYATTSEETLYAASMLRHADLHDFYKPYQDPSFCHMSKEMSKWHSTSKRTIRYNTLKYLDTPYFDIVQWGARVDSCTKEIIQGYACREHTHQFDILMFDLEEYRTQSNRRLAPINKTKRELLEEFKIRGLTCCVYCGGNFQHIDHVYPVSKGGSSDWHNLVPACSSCNIRKSNTDPWEWMKHVFPGQDHQNLFTTWGIDTSSWTLAKQPAF